MTSWKPMIIFNGDQHAETCALWAECSCRDTGHHDESGLVIAEGRHWLYRQDASCSCGAGPIVYRGDTWFPSRDPWRAGVFEIAEIDERYQLKAGDSPWPYLRVSIAAGDGEDTLVLDGDPLDRLLDADQVREVHEYLGSWLARHASLREVGS